jgi:hypothetical protein
MDKDFAKMIRINTQGRVFLVCQSRGITDQTIVGYYVDIVEQAVVALLAEDSTPVDFQRILEEQLLWLEKELDQIRDDPPAAVETAQAQTDPQIPDLALEKEEKRPTGYVPEAKSMPDRLKDQRLILEELLDNDCVTLKLVTPNEAKEYKHNLLGKDSEKAEADLVAALRNVLYNQMRMFIRKHNGGPWASATQQHEMRMDITKTRTLRSLVALARELLSEREEWLQKTKGSLSGRFFGGRVKMDK